MSTAAAELWSRYVSHFSFTQLGWLFSAFQELSSNDVISEKGDLIKFLEEWLGHQWPCILQKVKDDAVAEASKGHPLPLDFGNFIEFLAKYQDCHLEREDNAGFDVDNIQSLSELYHHYNGLTPGDGLKGKALYSMLNDIGIEFHSKEEREWYVEVVKKFDRECTGSINFSELCQILRKVMNMEEEKDRRRQFDLIVQSGLPFAEVEDWNQLFIGKVEEGKSEMSLGQVKELIIGLGVKWDKEFSDQVQTWISESDVNHNDCIDFGEFCLVLSKLWSSNLHDIRGAARTLLVKDRVVSLMSVHNTFLSALKDGTVMATAKEAKESETFVMKMNPNGNVCLQSSSTGKLITVNETELSCREDSGTQFKVTTLEDERVTLAASTPTGGLLYVRDDGVAAVSDGNPADLPFITFSVVSHEELHKKCWSKCLVTGATKQKVAEAPRKRSKDLADIAAAGGNEQVSPGMAIAINDMDQALETQAILSARG